MDYKFLTLAAASLITTPVMAGFLSKNAVASRTVMIEKKQEEKSKDHDQSHKKMQPGYNAPARSDPDWYFSASYLFWEALEDGLTLAWTFPSALTPAVDNTAADRVEFDFEYKSGFKVDFGTYFKRDSWGLNFGYTHFAFTQNNTKHASDEVFGQEEWLLSTNQDFSDKIKAKWHLNLNFADADLSRPFYSGTKLTLTPFFGMRAAWIFQKYGVTYTTLTPTEAKSKSKSSSWAIGARGGLNGHWLLGRGFRIQGNAAASLLYTHYNIRHQESSFADVEPLTPRMIAKETQQRGRFIGELGLGLGWGKYINNRKQRLDLSAAYDFVYLPAQNVMRQLKDDYDLQSSTGASDLFLHGLTVTGSIDF